MRKSTSILMTLLVAAVGGCAVLTYLWIDCAVSLSYAKQSTEIAISSAQGLRTLLENDWRGRSEVQILQALETAARQRPNAMHVVKREAGAIWFDEERFNFKDGQLMGIGDK